MAMKGTTPILAGAVILLAAGSGGAQEIQEERIRFETGTSSATVEGKLTGYQIVDYVLGARGGQTMDVSFETDHLASYFNVLPPDSETALFVGSTGGTTGSGLLPDDGDYRIRVYLMRSAARRDESADYTLSVTITGNPPTGAPAADAKVPGTPYHARGRVPCSVGPDEKESAECEFGVIRGEPGVAEVHLALPGGSMDRVLRFDGASVEAADADARLTAEKKGDGWEISVNDFEYYVIPEAVVYGG